MSRIEPAQGNRTLMDGDVPALPVELARLNSPVTESMLAKEAWYCDVPFMNVTIGS